MRREAIINDFCNKVNEGLNSGIDVSEQVHDALKGSVDSSDFPLLTHLLQNFQQALHPTEFSTYFVTHSDTAFEQNYELRRIIFDPSVLGPRNHYVGTFTNNSQASRQRIMLVRSFRVSGMNQYDATGKLIAFQFEPLSVTESAVCAISGSLMSLENVGRPHECIAGIGHLATRQAFRRQGHARILTEAFEKRVFETAASLAWNPRLILLESESESRPFWASCGYRWPQGSRYMQPPIEFDPDSGKPLFDEVPELLMVKAPETPQATNVDTQLLHDSVLTIYKRWYKADSNNEMAAREIDNYVFGKLFADFVASIEPLGELVPLVMPPQ